MSSHSVARLADSVLPPAIDTDRFAVLEQLLGRLTNDDIGAVLVMLTDIVTPTALDFLADHFSLLDEGWQFVDNNDHKRALIKSAIEIHRHKGTPWALKKLINIYGLDVKVFEWFDTHELPRTLSPKDVDLVTDVANVNHVINVLPVLVEASPVSNTLQVVSLQNVDLPNYLTAMGLGQVNIRGVTQALAEDHGVIKLGLKMGCISIAGIQNPFAEIHINTRIQAAVMSANYQLQRTHYPLFAVLSTRS